MQHRFDFIIFYLLGLHKKLHLSIALISKVHSTALLSLYASDVSLYLVSIVFEENVFVPGVGYISINVYFVLSNI